MKKICELIFGILIVLLVISNNTTIHATEAEKAWEKEEEKAAEENKELERFLGYPEASVWQIFCTEMYQILENEQDLFIDGYIDDTYSRYSTKIYNAKQNIYFYNNDPSESEANQIRSNFSLGLKDKENASETDYYKLQEALFYYAQIQLTIGEPVYFDFDEGTQATIDELAKEGFNPEEALEEDKMYEDTKETETPENTTSDIDDAEQESKEKDNTVLSFFLGGGITLCIVLITGILLIINAKKKKSEYE